MKPYTIWADTGFNETAEVAGRVLGRWLDEHRATCLNVKARYGTVYVDFVAVSDVAATFCATAALRECGMTDFPAGVRQGYRVVQTQRGTKL